MPADVFAIEEDFEVLGSDNRPVGQADGVTDDGLKLARRTPARTESTISCRWT
jgi:hypothetical protein